MAGTLSQGREQTSKVWAALSPHRSLWNHPFLERHIDHRVGAPTGRNWVQHMHAELLGGAPPGDRVRPRRGGSQPASLVRFRVPARPRRVGRRNREGAAIRR
jgi:hypothetical protein